MFRELDWNRTVFSLPAARFYPGDPSKDFSVRFHDRVASSPLGPAAGPHTQMAQNIVLCYLGGCRIVELKTVQALDEVTIPRPCIDMRTVGFNAEWSQELKLEQSLEEYVKASMLVEMLEASGALSTTPGFDRVLFDMSVGYDLEGIRNDRVAALLRGMRDAGKVVDRLRRQIPAAFKQYRDLDFTTRLGNSVTLSTFHGCPPGEIENIIEHLLEAHGLDCIIKFNPTLLGKAETLNLLHDELGYRDIRVPDSAFEKDVRWDQAAALTDRLGDRAAGLGLHLGVKFTNTLIVENNREFLPGSESLIYLSGPPLHILAMHLVRLFRRHFGNRFPVSFSAGVTRSSFPDAVALGLVPVTVCTDLLKTGGYGRLQAYHAELARRMEAAGASSVEAFIRRAHSTPEQNTGEHRIPEAVLHNTEHYVEAVAAYPRFGFEKNARPPRKIGNRLAFFDCIACGRCIPVCPNNANFTFTPSGSEIPVEAVRRNGSGWHWRRGTPLALEAKFQIGNFADFCNECGNCDVFCPEDGGPYRKKPRFFSSEQGWRDSSRNGFYLEEARVLGRFDDGECMLEVSGERVIFSGHGFHLTFDPTDPEGTLAGEAEDEVDLTRCHIMYLLLEAVLDTEQVNHVNGLKRRAR